MIRVSLLLALFATPLAAQDSLATLQKKMSLGSLMTVEDFRAMAEGNTITYNNMGEDLYMEYYRPGTNRVVIEWTTPSEDGQINCDIGTWYEENEAICFEWNRTGKVCSLWVDFEGQYISELLINGQRAGNIETISNISPTPLYCEVGLVSLPALPPVSG